MTTPLTQFVRGRLNIIMFMCPFVLIPFIMVATGFTLSLSDTSSNWAGNAKIVSLTDLPNVNQILQLKGSLIARSRGNAVTDLIFTVASTVGSEPVNLEANTFVINYHDPHQRVSNLPWSWRFQGKHDGDNLLEEEELVQLTIPLSSVSQIPLGSNTPFVIELSPPQGAILSIQRTTPSQLDPIIDLDL